MRRTERSNRSATASQAIQMLATSLDLLEQYGPVLVRMNPADGINHLDAAAEHIQALGEAIEKKRREEG